MSSGWVGTGSGLGAELSHRRTATSDDDAFTVLDAAQDFLPVVPKVAHTVTMRITVIRHAGVAALMNRMCLLLSRQLKAGAFEQLLNGGSGPVQVVALAREHDVDHRDSAPPIVIAQIVERRPRTDPLQIVQVSVDSALDRIVQIIVVHIPLSSTRHESKAAHLARGCAAGPSRSESSREATPS